MDLFLYNPHRKQGYTYDITFHRTLFDLLQQKLHARFVQVIIGLRRTGKTTLMKQLIDALIQQNVSPEHILFWSFDTAASLQDVMDAFQSASGCSLATQTCYVFLDEIQKLPNRQNQIKIYYDLYPHIHFFVSGSASVWVKKIESLAGRMQQHILQPLSWKEYIQFHGHEYIFEKPSLYQKDIIRLFEHFVHRQFFDTFSLPIGEVKEWIQNLIQKILFEDMVGYYDIRYPDLLKRIYELYAKKPGMLLDYSALASDMKNDARTIQTYTHYLIENLLVRKLDQYSPNPLTKEKKLKKVYPSAPGLSYLYECSGELFEAFWAQQLHAISFFKELSYEVDIITSSHEELHCYECKYKNNVPTQRMPGLHYFQRKYPYAQQHLLTKDSLGDKKYFL